MPDVHLLWDGLPVWLELKVATKTNRIKLSPQQIAWHMAYYARGGASFFLVKAPSSSSIVLFEGKMGPDLFGKPITEVQGSWFGGLEPMFEALRPVLVDRYAGPCASG